MRPYIYLSFAGFLDSLSMDVADKNHLPGTSFLEICNLFESLQNMGMGLQQFEKTKNLSMALQMFFQWVSELRPLCTNPFS